MSKYCGVAAYQYSSGFGVGDPTVSNRVVRVREVSRETEN